MCCYRFRCFFFRCLDQIIMVPGLNRTLSRNSFLAIATQPKMINLFRVDENKNNHCFAAHVFRSCEQYCSALLHLSAGSFRRDNIASILLTTLKNMGSETLFSSISQSAILQKLQFKFCNYVWLPRMEYGIEIKQLYCGIQLFSDFNRNTFGKYENLVIKKHYLPIFTCYILYAWIWRTFLMLILLTGSVTSYNARMKYTHCSSTQLMRVQSAQYADFNYPGTFNQDTKRTETECSRLTNCQLKYLCGGKQSCELTLDNNVLPSEYCSNTSKQIYTKYTCVDEYIKPPIKKGNTYVLLRQNYCTLQLVYKFILLLYTASIDVNPLCTKEEQAKLTVLNYAVLLEQRPHPEKS